MNPTPKMPIPWLANPNHDDAGGEFPTFVVGDRLLVAVPLHKDCGGGYDIQVIVATECGFDDVHTESWSDWDWSDVEYYVPLDGVRKPEDVE